MPTREFLSAPEDGGWEAVLNKACLLATLSLVHLWKQKHIKPLLKVNKQKSLAPFQYQVIHAIMIFNFFAKIIGFIVLFEDREVVVIIAIL